MQPKTNLVEVQLQQTSRLNDKPSQVVNNVVYWSSFVNNSVGPSLPFVTANAPPKGPIGSACVVDSTFGGLTLGNPVVFSGNEAPVLKEAQSYFAFEH